MDVGPPTRDLDNGAARRSYPPQQTTLISNTPSRGSVGAVASHPAGQATAGPCSSSTSSSNSASPPSNQWGTGGGGPDSLARQHSPPKGGRAVPAANPQAYKDWPTPLTMPGEPGAHYGGTSTFTNGRTLVKENNTRL